MRYIKLKVGFPYRKPNETKMQKRPKNKFKFGYNKGKFQVIRENHIIK